MLDRPRAQVKPVKVQVVRGRTVQARTPNHCLIVSGSPEKTMEPPSADQSGAVCSGKLEASQVLAADFGLWKRLRPISTQQCERHEWQSRLPQRKTGFIEQERQTCLRSGLPATQKLRDLDQLQRRRRCQ